MASATKVLLHLVWIDQKSVSAVESNIVSDVADPFPVFPANGWLAPNLISYLTYVQLTLQTIGL